MTPNTSDTTERADFRESWEFVHRALRDEIISGNLAPKSRLTETELAERFGMSRGPIRTALRELERVGLAVASSRRGLEVASFSSTDVEELHDLFQMLERQALIRGISSVTPNTRQRLMAVLERLDCAEDAGDAAEAVEADIDFHRQLALLGNNQRLLNTWDSHADQIRVVIAMVQRNDHKVASRNGEHPIIVDGLMSGDLELALRAHGRHFEASRRVISVLIDREISTHGSNPVYLHLVPQTTSDGSTAAENPEGK